MAFTVSQLSEERFEKIAYKHDRDVNAWEPINVSGLGPLIPIANTKANQLCVYYRFGIFKFTVAESTIITAGDAVYYNSANKVVQKTIPGDGFYLGKALSGGAGNATGTVSVEVSLNDNPAIAGNFGAENITTTGGVSCANVAASGDITCDDLTTTGDITCAEVNASGDITCDDLTTTGDITCAEVNASGDITCDDLTSSGIVASTSSQVIGIAKVKEVNTTATLTAADVIGGIVKSTPTGSISLTLPNAADLLALVPDAVVGTTVKFKVVNCAAETHGITLVASDSITNGGIAAHLGVAAATAASFEIVFTNVTAGSVAAVLYRG
jgi:hypothetical protein